MRHPNSDAVHAQGNASRRQQLHSNACSSGPRQPLQPRTVAAADLHLPLQCPHSRAHAQLSCAWQRARPSAVPCASSAPPPPPAGAPWRKSGDAFAGLCAVLVSGLRPYRERGTNLQLQSCSRAAINPRPVMLWTACCLCGSRCASFFSYRPGERLCTQASDLIDESPIDRSCRMNAMQRSAPCNLINAGCRPLDPRVRCSRPAFRSGCAMPVQQQQRRRAHELSFGGSEALSSWSRSDLGSIAQLAEHTWPCTSSQAAPGAVTTGHSLITRLSGDLIV